MIQPADTLTPDRAALTQVRNHLLSAQALMDAVDPNSAIAARLQHLIDLLEVPIAERT